MKKKTLIVIILCVLLAAAIILGITGVQAQNGGSFAGNSSRNVEVTNSSPLATIELADEFGTPGAPD